MTAPLGLTFERWQLPQDTVDQNAAPLIFDGHNDLLLRLDMAGDPDASASFAKGRKDGALDHEKCSAGGFGGGFFAVYVPSPFDMDATFAKMTMAQYQLELPEPIPYKQALPVAMSQISHLLKLQARGDLKICTTAAQIKICLENNQLAAVLHMEGAEAIDYDLAALDVLYAAGLRSLGPVWSRNTIFAEGVPFAYPATPDFGEGLSEVGLRLLRACNEKRIMIDLSHLNEAGFWDVAKHSDAPLVATHSNAHAICPNARNLTDKQLAAIAESDGMVGVNFATSFLRSDGRMIEDTTLDTVLQHFDHLMSILGEDRVGFGTDFDGALVPAEIKDAAGLGNLRAAMRAHGYDEALMTKLCHGNWLRVLEKTWGE
jgi:membrane dipeptidase